jgi:hypothetical protein
MDCPERAQHEAQFHGTITRLWPTAFTNMVLSLLRKDMARSMNSREFSEWFKQLCHVCSISYSSGFLSNCILASRTLPMGVVGVALTYALRKKKTLNLLRLWQRYSERCIRIILLCVPMLIRTYVSKEDVCGDDHVPVVSMIFISVYYQYLLSARVDGYGVNPRASICFPRFAKSALFISSAIDQLLRPEVVGPQISRALSNRMGQWPISSRGMNHSASLLSRFRW